VQIVADADPAKDILPPQQRIPKINITVVGEDKNHAKGDRWWITFKNIVEHKSSPKDKADLPNDPKRDWQIDSGFESKTSQAYIDAPGGDAPKGASITRTAFYAVGIVCRSSDRKSVSPLIASFVFSMKITHDQTGKETAEAEFKIPDGTFPANWADLLGVKVDKNLTCC
jgi:hypothetical protein